MEVTFIYDIFEYRIVCKDGLYGLYLTTTDYLGKVRLVSNEPMKVVGFNESELYKLDKIFHHALEKPILQFKDL